MGINIISPTQDAKYSIKFTPIKNKPLYLKVKYYKTEINNNKFDDSSFNIETEGISFVEIDSTFKKNFVGLKILDTKKTFDIFSRKYINSISATSILYESKKFITIGLTD